MSGPVNATKRITHINDKLIIEREPATGPHPRTRVEGSVYKGIENVLLEDGTETKICSECGWAADTTMAVSSHRSAAHIRATFQRYSQATLRALIREVHRAKKAGIRGFAEAAAKALNDQGIKTVSGQDWTPSVASHVYNQYKDRYRVRLSKREVVVQPAAPNGHGKLLTLEEVSDDGLTIKQEFLTLVTLVEQAATALQQLAAKIDRYQPADPRVVDKARRWDEFQALMKTQSSSG